MLNVLFFWSQLSQNPVLISLSREYCVCYPHPGVIFMVEWLVMIKQWCYMLCVAPMKKIMKCMNSIDLMRQTNKMTNFEDYDGIFSIPFSCFRFLSLHVQLRQSSSF